MTRSVPTIQIADVLTANLKAVLDNLCDQRYGGPISLERIPDSSSSSSTVTFRLDREGVPPLWAHFAIGHVGGNVYDVEGRVENGPSQSFTYSLPDPPPDSLPQAPHLARKVAAFLLDALERQIGSDLLRHEVRERLLHPAGSSSRAPSSSYP